MKIQFLGTAAAEAAPAVFCACDHCRYAREKGGKEIRTRSGALIDGKIKIDFGPDSYAHSLQYGLDYSLLHSVLLGVPLMAGCYQLLKETVKKKEEQLALTEKTAAPPQTEA